MRVRLALEEDTDDIVALSKMSCDLSTPYLEFSEEKVRETVRDYLDHCTTTIFVAEDDREVVGLLVATLNEYRHATGLYTTQEVIFIRPDKRGSRAAAMLMLKLIDWSRELGAIEITGGNDNKVSSERTARFLGKLGFEQVGFFMRRMMNDG